MTNHTPDFTSPLAGRIEVRQPCPWCGDRQMIPRIQFDEHVMRLHPDVTTSERRAVLAGEPAEPAPADQATAGPAREYLTAVVSRAVYEYREQACQWDESDGTTEEIARRVVNALLRDRQEQPAPTDTATVRAAALREAADGSGREAEAELYVLLRKSGEDRHEAQALIDRHRDEVLRRAELRRLADETQDTQPATACGREAVLNKAALHLYTALFPAVYADMGQKAAEGVNRAVSELRRLADDDRHPAPGPTALDDAIAALQARATALSVEAEAEMRSDLEERAQTWHEAAELARRVGRKAAHRARPGGPADTPTTKEAQRPVHAVPLPGSNGLSSCCGRPPCEFVGERVTRDPDEVTCPGPDSR
jgi:hypothetical protein